MKPIYLIVISLIFSFRTFAENPPKQIFSIVFPDAERLSANTARIPLKKFGQLIVIEARLMGKSGHFIIDTGSETMILNAVHYSANPRTQKMDQYGIDGKIDQVLKKNLESFTIGNLVWDNKKSDVIDLSHIEKSKKMKLLGIIGYNYLKDHEIFIDLYLDQITLTKVDENGNRLDDKVYLESVSGTLAFSLKNHSIILETDINNKTYKFCLDSGAEFNQINNRFVKQNQDDFYVIRKIDLTGMGGKISEVIVGLLKYLKIDNEEFNPMNTMLTDLSYSYEAFGTRIDGVLGYEFFKQRRTIINYQKETLYFVNFPEKIK
jgi:hypothetical protein